MAKKDSSGNKFDPAFLKKRMFYMQEFLNSVCDHVELRGSPEVLAFLQIQSHDEFEKTVKEFDKSSNPNNQIAASGFSKKIFFGKPSVQIESINSSSGTADCSLNSNLKDFSVHFKQLLKDFTPKYEK